MAAVRGPSFRRDWRRLHFHAGGLDYMLEPVVTAAPAGFIADDVNVDALDQARHFRHRVIGLAENILGGFGAYAG